MGFHRRWCYFCFYFIIWIYSPGWSWFIHHTLSAHQSFPYIFLSSFLPSFLLPFFLSFTFLPSRRVLNNCNWTRLGSFTYSVVSLPTLQYTLSICLLRSEKNEKRGRGDEIKESRFAWIVVGVSERFPSKEFTTRDARREMRDARCEHRLCSKVCMLYSLIYAGICMWYKHLPIYKDNSRAHYYSNTPIRYTTGDLQRRSFKLKYHQFDHYCYKSHMDKYL